MDIKIVFGKVLRQVRKDKKISQEKLALEADLDRSYVSKMETGVYQPSISTIIAIAQILEIRAGLLLDMVEEELARNSEG